MEDVVRQLFVLIALTSLYVLPSWLPAKRWLARGPWPLTALSALLLGWLIQIVIGLYWSRHVRVAPLAEGLCYLGFFGVASLLAILWPRPPQAAAERMPAREGLLLGMILLAAVVIRSIHPWQHAALGQSDAYTHLRMLRQLLAWGFFDNESYPSGFAWIMALPATTFQLDPYYLARFGGAFFGTAMVLAVYALVRTGSTSGVPAIYAAALVACFPGLMLLIKTGVGAVANHAGLALLPLVLLGYLLMRGPGTRGRGALWLAIGLACMALTVPMMLLHVCAVLLLVLLFDGPWTRADLRRRGALIVLLSAAVGGLLAIHVAHMSPRQRSVTAIMLTSADATVGSAQVQPQHLTPLTTLGLLARDFTGIKRWGLHSLLLDAALLGLVLVFLAVLLWGIHRRQRLAVLLGCWGGLASVQVATGWLQFTAYQREGWSLLIAVGSLSGVFAGALCAWRARLQTVLIAGVALSSVWTFTHPPAHPLLNSSAEEELIRAIRLLRNFPQWATPSDAANGALRDFLAQQLDPHHPVSLCARSLIQPDVFRSVAGPNPRLVFRKVTWNHPISEYMAAGGQFLVILDEPEDLSQRDFGVFGNVSPALRQNFVDEQRLRYAINHEMETCVAGLSRDEWIVAEHTVSPSLRMIVVRRLAPVTSGRPNR